MAYYYNIINLIKFITDRQLNQKLVSRYLSTYIIFFKSKTYFQINRDCVTNCITQNEKCMIAILTKTSFVMVGRP